jgi:hypothetical protein
MPEVKYGFGAARFFFAFHSAHGRCIRFCLHKPREIRHLPNIALAIPHRKKAPIRAQ